MEQHETDPKSSGDEDPWKKVSGEFVSLGGHLKDTYRRVAGEGSPSDDELRSAFATLSHAWNRMAESLSTALKDPDTRGHLKDTASSLASALGATLSQLGEEIDSADDQRDEEERR